jgi:hypothetical protein
MEPKDNPQRSPVAQVSVVQNWSNLLFEVASDRFGGQWFNFTLGMFQVLPSRENRDSIPTERSMQ